MLKVWRNPPGGGGLGMLVPAGHGAARSRLLGGACMTYSEDGYVKDGDAAKIDYDKLLKQMQEGTHEANKERRRKH